MLNTIQCEVAQTTSNNMNINKTVINLDVESQLQRLQHSHSPKHENQHGITSNSNTTVPSISISTSTSSSSSTVGINGIGTTSSTPIDLTRSTSHSYPTSVATSNPVSGPSSPTIPKLVNQHHVMESNGRKRPLDPPNYAINAISSAPQRKRQKIETNMNAQAPFVVNNSNVNHNNLLNLHNHNNVAGTNQTFTANPLNNLQRSLLAGKQNLLLNPAQKVKKPIDVTLVQLVQYLKSQFAKYQENQSQHQSQTTSVSSSTTPNQAHHNNNNNNKQNLQHLLANYMQPGHHNNPQQLLMNMMNKNKAHNNTAMLQSLLRLKQQQQIQQNTEKQNALLNAINATRSAQTQTHNQQYNNNNNSNNSGGLANLMASLQNIQNINNANNSMNMLLSKNRNISNLVATNYSLSNTNTNSNANSHSNSNLNSQKKLKKPKKKNHIKNNIEIVTLVSDEDDASSKLKSKLKKKRRNKNKKKRKSAKAEIISNAVHSEISIKSMTRRKRKRKRSPSATSTRSRSTVSAMNSDGSDESYKYVDEQNGDNKVRQRKKRMCNIDKEFDAEERMIAYREDMLNCAEPISGNAYIVAYAESLHLGDMQLLENECFPVLKHMPRSALIKYCDYYKLRYSKRSKDNRLLQIVTRHFILHNREKNKYKTTQDMEQDLFWHSVCYQENNENVENDSTENRNES